MVKQKNHTNRGMTGKAHRNGIKKAKRERYSSTKGVSFIYVKYNLCYGCITYIIYVRSLIIYLIILIFHLFIYIFYM